MSYHRLPTAPLASRHRGAGGGTVDNRHPQGSTYLHPISVQSNGATSIGSCGNDDHCEHAFHVVGKAHHTIIRNNITRDFNAHVKVNGFGDDWPDDGLIEHNSFTNSRPRHTDNPVALLNINSVDRWHVTDNVIANFIKPGGNDQTAFGVFMKGAGKQGIIERNLVICTTRELHQPGIRVGISFGGGGTGPQYCRDRACKVEHSEGIAANNIVAHCNDFGIDVNRSTGIQVTHNTLINTEGIDVRDFPATANIISNKLDGRIRSRKGGWLAESDNTISNFSTDNALADSLNISWPDKTDGKTTHQSPHENKSVNQN